MINRILNRERKIFIRSIAVVFAMTTVTLSLPSPAFAQKLSDTLSVQPDSSEEEQRDTIVSTPHAISDGDSLKKARAFSDTALKEENPLTIEAQTGTEVEDTTYCFWQHPYWGIGAGWGLGSFPLYAQWEGGLPDSSSKLAGPGSVVPNFKIREPVNSYNIFWPLLVSVSPFVNERHALSLESALYFLFSGKSFKASLATGNDSLRSSVEWSQSCAVTFFSIGFDYRRRIPEEYFKVENVKRTTANIGLSVVPLMRFAKRASYSFTDIPDSTIATMEKNIDNRSFNGMGCSWKLGISSLRKLSPKSGVEIGISYIGRYLGYFKNSGAGMLWKDLNPNNSRPDEKVSFLSHTFELSLMLQSGKAKPGTLK